MLRWYRKQKKKREYHFGKPIGYGTYAEVREAIKKSTGEKVAIKIISKKLLSTTDKPLIEREIASLNSVRHPNIIVLKDWFESDKKVYLVFELAGGGELFDRIYTLKQFSERDAARLIKSITSAVKVLHDHGIIHRDLKPENILFKSQDPNSDIVIADFGVATFADDDELFYTICGSPGYAAPEILLGRGHHKAVDVWSIGVITYTLLSGYAPFTPTDDLSKMVSKMLNNRLTFHHKYWSHISDTAKDFISQLLNPDPSLRPSCAEILQHPWLQDTPGGEADYYNENLLTDCFRNNLVTVRAIRSLSDFVNWVQRCQPNLAAGEIGEKLDVDESETLLPSIDEEVHSSSFPSDSSSHATAVALDPMDPAVSVQEGCSPPIIQPPIKPHRKILLKLRNFIPKYRRWLSSKSLSAPSTVSLPKTDTVTENSRKSYFSIFDSLFRPLSCSSTSQISQKSLSACDPPKSRKHNRSSCPPPSVSRLSISAAPSKHHSNYYDYYDDDYNHLTSLPSPSLSQARPESVSIHTILSALSSNSNRTRSNRYSNSVKSGKRVSLDRQIFGDDYVETARRSLSVRFSLASEGSRDAKDNRGTDREVDIETENDSEVENAKILKNGDSLQVTEAVDECKNVSNTQGSLLYISALN